VYLDRRAQPVEHRVLVVLERALGPLEQVARERGEHDLALGPHGGIRVGGLGSLGDCGNSEIMKF
jgi:hypothetical protein